MNAQTNAAAEPRYSLSREELAALKAEWRLADGPSDDPERSIDCADLLDQAKAAAYVAGVRASYGGEPTTAAAASQFAKRYSFLAVVPSLYAMTMFDKGLNFAVDNCRVESAFRDEIWLPSVRLSDMRVTVPGDDRAAWRAGVAETIFAGHLAKVWASVSKAARVPSAVLWENTAVYVYWLYERAIGKHADDAQRARIEEDFRFLLEAPARLFGTRDNPIAKYNSDKSRISTKGEPIRVRKTCCLYYQVSEDHAYCSTCPLTDCGNNG